MCRRKYEHVHGKENSSVGYVSQCGGSADLAWLEICVDQSAPILVARVTTSIRSLADEVLSEVCSRGGGKDD